MVTNVDPKHLANLKEPVILRFEHLKVKYDKPLLLLKRIVIKLLNLVKNKEKVNIVPANYEHFRICRSHHEAVRLTLVATSFW